MLIHVNQDPDGTFKGYRPVQKEQQQKQSGSVQRYHSVDSRKKSGYSVGSRFSTIEQISEDDIKGNGWVFKQSRWVKKWRKRWCVLTPRALYTFESENIRTKATEKI